MGRPIRVLLAKPGLDGHDLGVKVVAAALRDAGMEVIYGGLCMAPADIVLTAKQEDVDVIGLSMLSGAHMDLCEAVHSEMERQSLGDVLVIVGGVIPREDFASLQTLGVRGIFGPGAHVGDIVRFIEDNLNTPEG